MLFSGRLVLGRHLSVALQPKSGGCQAQKFFRLNFRVQLLVVGLADFFLVLGRVEPVKVMSQVGMNFLQFDPHDRSIR